MVRIRSIDEQPERDPGDARDLDPIGRPPGGGDAARVRDLLVVPSFTSDGDWRRFPPFQGEPADLGRGLRLEVLADDESDLVMNACTERGHHFWAMRQFDAMYAFVLEVNLAVYEQHSYAWDVDGVLRRALQLSRLIQDNGYGTTYAARVVDFDGGFQQVIPQAHWHPYFIDTYRVRDDRDWFTGDQAEELAQLLDCWWRNEAAFPVRIQRSLSLAEGVVHQAVIERALVMLFMGFEALINTGKTQVTKQVGVRLRALAQELEFDGISRSFVEDMYDDRSSPAHGHALEKLYRGTPKPALPEGAEQEVGQDDERGDEVNVEYLAKLAKLQDFQRAILRKAIQEAEFAAIFASDEMIEQRWPLPPEAE
jgi:hypothetical protein